MSSIYAKDPWIDDNLLCHLFPRVYALESNCDIYVADKMIDPVNGSLRRPARGGIEAHQLSQLQLVVGPVILSNANDRWVWSLSGDGVFQVKDIRRLLDESFLLRIYAIIGILPKILLNLFFSVTLPSILFSASFADGGI
ncbi:hypothetical protein Tco_1493346 [Tanacetum coccineum]